MKIILDAMGGDNAPLAPVMGAVQAAKLLACRNGLRDLDEPVLHEGALVLYREVVLDAVVRHLQDLRCVHGPFRLRLVLHVQVRIVKQPRHRECNHGEDG